MTSITQDELEALPLHEQKRVAALGMVPCIACGQVHAWLGDQGACIELHGKCLTCLLLNDYPEAALTPESEAEADAKVARVLALREAREAWTGRRVFPCPGHVPVGCPLCGGHGWIVGYPPGRATSG